MAKRSKGKLRTALANHTARSQQRAYEKKRELERGSKAKQKVRRLLLCPREPFSHFCGMIPFSSWVKATSLSPLHSSLHRIIIRPIAFSLQAMIRKKKSTKSIQTHAISFTRSGKCLAHTLHVYLPSMSMRVLCTSAMRSPVPIRVIRGAGVRYGLDSHMWALGTRTSIEMSWRINSLSYVS